MWRFRGRARPGRAGALEAALIESRARYKSLVELSSDFAWETGPDGTFVFVSPRGALGYDADELVGRHPDSFAVAPRKPGEPSPFAARVRVSDAVVWWRRKDGTEACLTVSSAPVEDAAGAWQGTRGVCRDATESLVRDDALAAARRRDGMLAHILHVMRDVAVPAEMLAAAAAAAARVLGARGGAIYAVKADGTPARAAAFGPPSDPNAMATLAEAARGSGGIAAADGPGARRIACPTLYRWTVNGVVAFERDAAAPPWSDEDRALLADIADRVGLALAQVAAHEALAHLARTDPLTGLLNRRAFLGDLAARLARRGADTAPAALLFIDLDNFKSVNDRSGHDGGDAALKEVAALLAARTRPGDLVARFGGDEFALWLERIAADALAERAAELVAAAGVLARFSAPGRPPLGFSIGAVAWRGGAHGDAAALIDRADEAMYRVKRSGKGGFVVVDATDPSAPAALRSVTK